MAVLEQIDEWPCQNAAAVLSVHGELAESFGDLDRVFPLASVTKLLTAATVLVGSEEGSVTLDDDAGDGASLADLLAHASGLGPDGTRLDAPGRRRVYSNAGYERAAGLLASGSGLDFSTYFSEALIDPLGMSATELLGSPAFGARSSVTDLDRFLQGLGRLLTTSTLQRMIEPHRAELSGVLPGYGSQSPNLWGLGPEIRGHKALHWTGELAAPETWGHFGQAGTFVWSDPTRHTSLIVLTDLRFGAWAPPRWAQLSSDAVSFVDS